ncbi:endonuclease domain-containing 1 protein-like [Channa argus]|uniref:endonuclease domain-containing 1 protein-like n=1 Tax=Channa argus TaxID=215402 RepID=UPI002944029E|nr:hypothetical protein Q8A73_023232 [Channa argus]
MQSLVTICGLLFVIIPAHAHVSEDFKECRQFFFGNMWPEWPPSRYHQEICQTYENNYYFATLYDIKRRIPVYSAYIFEQGNDHPTIPWCIEPQLVNLNLNKNMMRSDDLVKKSQNPKVKLSDIEEVQAVYDDYQVPQYDDYNRGHLNPKGHHKGSSSKATYTLTNVVPQNRDLNNGAWAGYEQKLISIFTNCHKAYVVVGAIASTNPESWIKRNNKKRVNIPDYLWQAYCCTDKQGSPTESGAATAKNTENRVELCSLKSLKEFFGKLGKTAEPFQNCNAPARKDFAGDCSSVIE